MDKCDVCGYVLQTAGERNSLQNYGCARAKVIKTQYSFSVESCDSVNGVYYPVQTEVEQGDSFQEGYLTMKGLNKQEDDKKDGPR